MPDVISAVEAKLRFRQNTLKPDQHFDRWVSELRELASNCNWTQDIIESNLQDQITCGVCPELQTKLLIQEDLTLSQHLRICRNFFYDKKSVNKENMEIIISDKCQGKSDRFSETKNKTRTSNNLTRKNKMDVLEPQTEINGNVRRSSRVVQNKNVKYVETSTSPKNRRSTKRPNWSSDSSETSDYSASEEEEYKISSSKFKKKRKNVVSESDEDFIPVNNKSATNRVGSDNENYKAFAPKGRRHIRPILSDLNLEKGTKIANLAETQRRKRVAQKSENGMHEFISDNNVKIYTQYCFEKDEQGNDLVFVSEDIVDKLKPHQIEGIQFFWDCTVESVERANTTDGSGAILAHYMGLGKTLQVIAYMHSMLTCSALPFRTLLVLVPTNTILNWINEFEMWTPDNLPLNVFELTQQKDLTSRLHVLTKWQNEGGVMILGYQMFRLLLNPAQRKYKRYDKLRGALWDPGPDFVVCDEGHLLKNDQSALSKSVSQIKTKRRIVLTGTPLQNNLVEYHCMVNFVKENLLGTRKEFRNRFVNPITNGQQKDASCSDVKIMKNRSHVLHELLSGCIQRRDYAYMATFLPPKYEYTLSIRMSETQVKLYSKYLFLFCSENAEQSLKLKNSTLSQLDQENRSQIDLLEPKSGEIDLLNSPRAQLRTGKVTGRNVLRDFQALSRIWTHPYCVTLPLVALDDGDFEAFGDGSSDCSVDENCDEAEKKVDAKANEIGVCFTAAPANAVNDSKGCTIVGEEDTVSAGVNRDRGSERESQALSTCESSASDSEKEVSDNTEGGAIAGYAMRTRSQHKEEDLDSRVNSPVFTPEDEECWYGDAVTEMDQWDLTLSGKLVLLCDILKQCDVTGEKVLVFSQSLMSLNLIEQSLQLVTEAHAKRWTIGETDEEGFTYTIDGSETGNNPQWIKGKDYLRLDGSTNTTLRKKMVDEFNSENSPRCRLFLISTKAGSLGVNLVAANRAVIFDCSWNPSHDEQAIFRCYRFGQTKPVYVYRFVAQGTMEEKIYNRQVTKESLSLRVLDENQIDRHFSRDQLGDLYKFEPRFYAASDARAQPFVAVPKDNVLADMLLERKYFLYQYHEHDSLLQHQQDETLTEDDKQSAWGDYQREKERANHLREKERAYQARKKERLIRARGTEGLNRAREKVRANGSGVKKEPKIDAPITILSDNDPLSSASDSEPSLKLGSKL